MRSLVVHGGAGTERPVDRAPRRLGVTRAAEVGWGVMARGGSALDAVVEAVVVLEDDPNFNAGRGSVLTEDGVVEMDASVMEGTKLRAGGVGAVAGVVNPIRAARAVLEAGREVLLVGDAAAAFARSCGLPVVAPDALVTDEARRRWLARTGGATPTETTGETVGAVACDAHGRLAAATSTGGVAGKRQGRVGDSALIGAGTCADDLVGAASATGPGEAIIRIGLVQRALELLARDPSAANAARGALDLLARRLQAEAGLIVVDALGRVGIAYTTPAMPAAWVSEDAARVEVVG